jgi:putative membrane protein
MKWLIKALIFNGMAIYFLSLIYGGFEFNGEFLTLVYAAGALTLLNMLVKPLIKLLLLPINILTLGLFGFLSNVVTFFLLTRLVSGLSIVAYTFEGFSASGFVVPSVAFGLFGSYLIASSLLSLITSSLVWLSSS